MKGQSMAAGQLSLPFGVFAVLMIVLLLCRAEASAQETEVRTTTGPAPPPGISRGRKAGAPPVRVMIPGVPAYRWHHGCGPTAAGMVIGYWKNCGFVDLYSGDVCDIIASTGNFEDYCMPLDYYPNLLPDLSEQPVGDEHADDCIADFMNTSQSQHGNYYGWSLVSDVPRGLRGYVDHAAPHYSRTARNYKWFRDLTWSKFCAEIDANRPVLLMVDTDGNGASDHMVTAVGYGWLDGTPMYACHDTWDTRVHWFDFAYVEDGQAWGVYSATFFSLNVPRPDIKINGSDGPVLLPASERVEVSIGLDPGDLAGHPADWWVFVERNSSHTWWAEFVSGGRPAWTMSAVPLRFAGVPLMAVGSYPVLGPRYLPRGGYVWSFSVDVRNKNPEHTFIDEAELTVY